MRNLVSSEEWTIDWRLIRARIRDDLDFARRSSLPLNQISRSLVIASARRDFRSRSDIDSTMLYRPNLPPRQMNAIFLQWFIRIISKTFLCREKKLLELVWGELYWFLAAVLGWRNYVTADPRPDVTWGLCPRCSQRNSTEVCLIFRLYYFVLQMKRMHKYSFSPEMFSQMLMKNWAQLAFTLILYSGCNVDYVSILCHFVTALLVDAEDIIWNSGVRYRWPSIFSKITFVKESRSHFVSHVLCWRLYSLPPDLSYS